jgi:hypothetical protein
LQQKHAMNTTARPPPPTCAPFLSSPWPPSLSSPSSLLTQTLPPAPHSPPPPTHTQADEAPPPAPTKAPAPPAPDAAMADADMDEELRLALQLSMQVGGGVGGCVGGVAGGGTCCSCACRWVLVVSCGWGSRWGDVLQLSMQVGRVGGCVCVGGGGYKRMYEHLLT